MRKYIDKKNHRQFWILSIMILSIILIYLLNIDCHIVKQNSQVSELNAQDLMFSPYYSLYNDSISTIHTCDQSCLVTSSTCSFLCESPPQDSLNFYNAFTCNDFCNTNITCNLICGATCYTCGYGCSYPYTTATCESTCNYTSSPYVYACFLIDPYDPNSFIHGYMNPYDTCPPETYNTWGIRYTSDCFWITYSTCSYCATNYSQSPAF